MQPPKTRWEPLALVEPREGENVLGRIEEETPPRCCEAMYLLSTRRTNKDVEQHFMPTMYIDTSKLNYSASLRFSIRFFFLPFLLHLGQATGFCKMGLFKSKKSSKKKNSSAKGDESMVDETSHEGPDYNGVHENTWPDSLQHRAPHLSKTEIDIGGLPINVFGLEQLTPSFSRASAPPPPEVCVAIHMHGRLGSADNEEDLVRHLFERVHKSAEEDGKRPAREFLIVNFDARNHGHRMTNETGQKGWRQGNVLHALDLYAMIVGMAQDVSFIVDFLPAYLFPQDDRQITKWVVTGKSLGGHATWHVLANDPRIAVGVPFISCPSYGTLMSHRAKSSFVTYGPPHVPASLVSLIASIDPASKPYDSFDPKLNPFWGKRILMCSGEADKLVPWHCADAFVKGLITGEIQGAQSRPIGFQLVLEEGVGHTVTNSSKLAQGRLTSTYLSHPPSFFPFPIYQ
jgi:dienelactone hydrolase